MPNMTDKERRHFLMNLRGLQHLLEPAVDFAIGKANFSVLSRSKNGTHKADLWLDVDPPDLGLRGLIDLISAMPIFMSSLRQLVRERIADEDRDAKVREALEAADNDVTSADEALEAIRALMVPEPEEDLTS